MKRRCRTICTEWEKGAAGAGRQAQAGKTETEKDLQAGYF